VAKLFEIYDGKDGICGGIRYCDKIENWRNGLMYDIVKIPLAARVCDHRGVARELLKRGCGIDLFDPFDPDSESSIEAAYLFECPKGDFFGMASWLQEIAADEAAYARFGHNPSSAAHKAVFKAWKQLGLVSE
jgi:hypothetical protein